jgi:hypothetical protein
VSATTQSPEDQSLSYGTPEWSAPEVLRHAQDLLEEHLPLNADGYKCTTDDLFKVLVGVAATKSTLEAVCGDLVGPPDPHTIRGYFNEQLCVAELPELEQQLNAALAASPNDPRPTFCNPHFSELECLRHLGDQFQHVCFAHDAHKLRSIKNR